MQKLCKSFIVIFSDILSFINQKKLLPKPILDPLTSPPSSGQGVGAAVVSQMVNKYGSPSIGKYVDIPLSNMRSTIAKRLSSSKVIDPLLHLFFFAL